MGRTCPSLARPGIHTVLGRATAECHGPGPLPDLDRQPAIASVLGVDLHPVDAADPAERAWPEALVWPENHGQRALLAVALELAAADPPPLRAGDVADVLPAIAGSLPAGQPRVVLHAATRLHVPAGRRTAFDAAIERAGDTGPTWWLSIEGAPDQDARLRAGPSGRRLPVGDRGLRRPEEHVDAGALPGCGRAGRARRLDRPGAEAVRPRRIRLPAARPGGTVGGLQHPHECTCDPRSARFPGPPGIRACHACAGLPAVPAAGRRHGRREPGAPSHPLPRRGHPRRTPRSPRRKPGGPVQMRATNTG